jgi:hypothetical protein
MMTAVSPPPGETAKTRVCYGGIGARQAECAEITEGPVVSPAERIGQGVVAIGRHEILLDLVTELHTQSGLDPARLVRAPFEAAIAQSDHAGPVTVTVSGKWSFVVPARELEQIHALFLPAGQHRIELAAEHYAPGKAVVDATARPKPARLVLRRLPVLTGRVVTWNGEPAADASIQPLPGKSDCRADGAGAFQCEIADEWPSSVVVHYPGAGVRTVAVGREARDTSLGEIRLSRSVSLTVRVQAPPELDSITLSLFKDGKGQPVEIATRTAKLPSTDGVVLAGLEPGDYRLLIRGERPLQQTAITVRIGDAGAEQKIVIRESELTLRVRSGGQPEGGAAVVLKNLSGQWSGAVSMDDDGAAKELVWQTGEFTSSVRPRGAATPILDHLSLGEEESLQWTFDLPAARVEGRVLDDAGAPVANAEVHLSSDDGDMQTSLRTSSDANGRFAFDHIRGGDQVVSATAADYLPSQPVSFRLLPTDAGRRVDLAVKRGGVLRLQVVDGRNVPLPAATVFETLDNRLLSVVRTSASGEAEVRMPANASVVLIVVPDAGSFAIRRLGSADREAGSARVVVPDPAASLELRTETSDHAPVRDVHFLVRYEGETIPFDVLMQFAQLRNLQFGTGEDGTALVSNLPPGLYELWPYAKMTEIDTLMAGVDIPPPLRVALSQGRSTATLTFRRKRPGGNAVPGR